VLVSSGGTTITVTHAETTGDVGVDTVTAQITSAPTGSVNAALSFSASSEALGGPNGTGTYTASTKTDQLATSNAGVARAVFSPNRLATFTTTQLSLSLNADIAGTYTILVTADAASAAGFSAGKLSTTYTITTAGAPTSLTASSYAGSVTTSGQYGQLMKLTMKDAAGNATVLGLNEAIDITDNSTAVTQLNGFSSAGSAITSFGSASAHVNGTYFFRVVNTGTAIAADGTAVVTFTGGGLLPASLTTNASATLVKAVAATTGSTITVAPTTSTTVRGNASGSTAYSSGTMYAPGSVAVTFSVLTNDSTAAAVVIATEASDAAGAVYNSTVTKALTATTTNTTTVAGTVPAVTATGANTTLKILTALDGSGATNVTATASFGARAARTVAVLGSAAVLSATAGSTTWNVQVKDQYGTAIAFAPISVAVSGRNTVAATALGVTDANGIISYTLKDAGTTGTTDTLTFTSGSLTAATATVTYGTVTVAKVSFTGPNTTSGVATATTTVSPIRANDTPEASTAAASVVVTDASGNLLAGVPVVFTVSGTTAAITSNVVTVYTDSAGKAASTVFAWVAGTYTVTATAGGVTGTGSYTFANTTAADARVLSATVADGIISAKVVDRFGNPVSGVSVYASRTSGTGYFGSGVSKTTTTTGTDGIAEFTLIGTATVTVSTLDYAAAAGTNAPGQTCALAGNIDCAVGATAAKKFTATTEGTTAVAGKNIGSSFAPAGVSSVTVAVNNNAAADSSQAAADAAAEATDAANAATDAANAAAEAADAATAAAQDAADAVAALSTQVSEMVDALKKQITALTNLVIKIQKKVKA
jgi:hypothetical protein